MAPGALETLQKGGGRGPPPFARVSGAPGAAQPPKISELRHLTNLKTVFASRIPPRPLEDQRPCGEVLCSLSLGPPEGSKRIPEMTQEAQKEARDRTQKRTKGNLEEVMSPILRCHLLRLGRSLAAGKRPAHSLVANSQEVMCSGSGRA